MRSVHVALAAAATSIALAAPPASSQPAPGEPRIHVVAAGNTLGSIARRYGVSVRALREANDLAPSAAIRLGQRLAIPDAAPGGRSSTKLRDGETEGGRGGPPVHARTRGEPHGSATGWARMPKHPGVVRLVHGAESARIKLYDRSRRLAPSALESFSKMLRSWSTGTRHPIDPRLVALVGVVSDHFGGRDLVVVSGFRPFSPHQYTPHSNHNAGRAMDFAVRGVPNEALRDFCKSLRKVGVGYYPSSSFVHLDVRETNAFWIDYAGPGEPPRYHRPDAHLEADEGAGEVSPEGADPGPDAPDDGTPGGDEAPDDGSKSTPKTPSTSSE